jgi:hypothetical protein
MIYFQDQIVEFPLKEHMSYFCCVGIAMEDVLHLMAEGDGTSKRNMFVKKLVLHLMHLISRVL